MLLIFLIPVLTAWVGWELRLLPRTSCRTAGICDNQNHTSSHLSGWKKGPWSSAMLPDLSCIPLPYHDAPHPLRPRSSPLVSLLLARLKCHNKCTKEAPPCHLLIIHRGGKGLSSPFCLRGHCHQVKLSAAPRGDSGA